MEFIFIFFLIYLFFCNRYNLPFLQIVGVTSTNQTFSIAFVFVHNEKKSNYTWALSCLKLTMDDSYCPHIIVTDRDLALMNACENVFPDAKRLLCRWHISQSIFKHCRPQIKSQQSWESIKTKWDLLVKSPTMTKYLKNYADLQALLIEYPGIVILLIYILKY